MPSDSPCPHDSLLTALQIRLRTVLSLLTLSFGCGGSAEHPPRPGSPVPPVEWVTDVPARPWKTLVLHHSATETGSVESIDVEHKQRRDGAGRPWRGIGYHFVVGNGRGMPDGEIRPTFRWQDQSAGAHAGDAAHNEHGIGICLIGNFEEAPPTDKQLASARRLIGYLKGEFAIPADRIHKHGDLKATACPGKHFPDRELARTPAWKDPKPILTQHP